MSDVYDAKSNDAIDYSNFLSESGKRMVEDGLMKTHKLMECSKDSIQLAEGVPNDETFPLEDISIRLIDGSVLDIKPDSMKTVLQYGSSKGQVPIVTKAKHLMSKFHKISAWDKRDLLIVSGAQDGLSRAFNVLINPGDICLTHEPFYSSIKCVVSPYGAKMVGIQCDEDGILPDALQQTILSLKSKGNNRIKCLYVNPTAANPSGINFSKERKKLIYDIACEHNFLILEDDPYFFLQFTETKDLGDSFISMDLENRVLRFDSFSKIISSGFRLGFITGPTPLILKVELNIQGSIGGLPGVIQKMVSDLLEHWGDDGFMTHIEMLQAFYKDKRDHMLTCAQTYLTGLCEWNVPKGGMFLWIKVLDIEDTFNMVLVKGPKRGVFFLPGSYFMVDESRPCSYIRASFSKCSKEDVEKAFRILAELIKEEKNLTTSND